MPLAPPVMTATLFLSFIFFLSYNSSPEGDLLQPRSDIGWKRRKKWEGSGLTLPSDKGESGTHGSEQEDRARSAELSSVRCAHDNGFPLFFLVLRRGTASA